jgi:hypothetical protein
MTTQINLRVTEEFLSDAQRYADDHGYLSVQEFLRDAARDKLYRVRDEYRARLESEDARTLSDDEARAFEKELASRRA